MTPTPGRTVLLVKSHPGCGTADAAALTAAGNRVLHCFPDTLAGERRRQRFVCTGVAEGVCPLDAGVDVALVVRPFATTRPSCTEVGATCALRSGVPIAERGPAEFDPYDPWIDARAGGDSVAACERAIERHFDGLRQDVMNRIAPILAGADVRAEDVRVRFDTAAANLQVTISGPPLPHGVEARLAVRAADATRGAPNRFAKQSFCYEVVVG
jgi:hypothetical protein